MKTAAVVFLKWRESWKPNGASSSSSSLDAAVGECDVIGAGGLVSVPLLVLAEVVVRVVVLHRPTKKWDCNFEVKMKGFLCSAAKV